MNSTLTAVMDRIIDLVYRRDFEYAELQGGWRKGGEVPMKPRAVRPVPRLTNPWSSLSGARWLPPQSRARSRPLGLGRPETDSIGQRARRDVFPTGVLGPPLPAQREMPAERRPLRRVSGRGQPGRRVLRSRPPGGIGDSQPHIVIQRRGRIDLRSVCAKRDLRPGARQRLHKHDQAAIGAQDGQQLARIVRGPDDLSAVVDCGR